MAANRFGLVRDIDALSAYPKKHNARETKLAQDVLYNKNVDDTFESQPVISTAVGSGAAPAEAADAAVIALSTGRALYELYYAAVESTGTAVYKYPTVSADGLELPQDADHTDGPSAIELNNGITARSRCAFTVGTDDDFFFETKIKIDDISDVTSLFVGFRKAEAYQADPESYDEMAAFQIGGTADGQVNIWTILNNGSTTKTDTTLDDWLDAGEHTLRVTVRKTGAVEFSYDAAEPTVTQKFTFDSGEVVVPFLHLDGETGDAGVSLATWRCGKL